MIAIFVKMIIGVNEYLTNSKSIYNAFKSLIANIRLKEDSDKSNNRKAIVRGLWIMFALI
jgi:hypothetical protein